MRDVEKQSGVSFCAGVALWTTDIGGYSGGNPDSPSFQQMIVRWFQFGAKKRAHLSNVVLKTIILPRQARDKHRKS
eukprot:COSAG06_NODE_4820_length_3930_cov_4.506134_2_plen_76_part_00